MPMVVILPIEAAEVVVAPLMNHSAPSGPAAIPVGLLMPKPVKLVTVLRMVMVTLPQVSLAVGGSKDQVLVHSTVLLGTQVMVGGV